MKQKALYTKPEIEITRLNHNDVITISDLDIDIKEDVGENDGEWI